MTVQVWLWIAMAMTYLGTGAAFGYALRARGLEMLVAMVFWLPIVLTSWAVRRQP